MWRIRWGGELESAGSRSRWRLSQEGRLRAARGSDKVAEHGVTKGRGVLRFILTILIRRGVRGNERHLWLRPTCLHITEVIT